MGMFDFVKSVGKKLGIDGDEEAAPTADTLKKELDSHKLGTDGVQVAVQGDTAVLKGVVKDQSIFEGRRQHTRRLQGAGRRIAGRA